MSEDRQILEAKEYYQYLGKKRATCRDQADVFGQENAPVLADELNTVVDEDQGDFAELCLLFRV